MASKRLRYGRRICADCGTIATHDSIRPRYLPDEEYAGTYCSGCWNGFGPGRREAHPLFDVECSIVKAPTAFESFMRATDGKIADYYQGVA